MGFSIFLCCLVLTNILGGVRVAIVATSHYLLVLITLFVFLLGNLPSRFISHLAEGHYRAFILDGIMDILKVMSEEKRKMSSNLVFLYVSYFAAEVSLVIMKIYAQNACDFEACLSNILYYYHSLLVPLFTHRLCYMVRIIVNETAVAVTWQSKLRL